MPVIIFSWNPPREFFTPHSLSGREDEFTAGYKESANRKKIFAKFGGKKINDKFKFYWA